jgi:leucyl aminopeptidase
MPMRVSATTESPVQTGADTVAVGIFEGESVAHDVEGGVLGAMVERGEARGRFRHLAVAHAAGTRWLLVGLGRRDELTAERARVAAAVGHGRARELGTRTLCWELPHHVGEDVAGALVEGTVLAAYRFERYDPAEPDENAGAIEALVVSAHHDVSAPVEGAAIVAAAQNAARDLQNTPANDMTPTTLGDRALALAEEIAGVTAEVHGRDFLLERGMGAFAAVAQGTDTEPALIVLRYHGDESSGPVLGLVGKAVTFDSGGLSLKPAAKMHEMKFDMSGGAAVVEAVGAIARLRLPVSVVAVVGATENLPSGHSMRPGDIVTASDGTTIEINNTDAEGRLVLADCLVHARELGAERIVDIATLTGAIVVSLGSTYAGLMSDDDAWAATVNAAAQASGELVWRMPLHAEYADLIKGRYAQIMNAVEGRKAGSITAAEFLRRFAAGVPWAHVDIAGMAWEGGRPYAPWGGTGFGVRLLVDVARRVSAQPSDGS